MFKINIIVLLLLFMFLSKGYSQHIPNGYYNRIGSEVKTFIYIHNDTIILPYASGMMYASIRKGVIDKKRKWINFILIPVQERSPYAFYSNKKQRRMKFRYFGESQRIEILFNLPFNNYWNKYIKTEEPYDLGRSQDAIEKHVNDMKPYILLHHD